MKSLVFLLMLGCWAASSAFGRDSAESLRERIIFCSQFVIEDPGPVVVQDTTHDCCRLANPIRDCRLTDREEKNH
jgi:hypothetical protein